jgi:hypothetical protein
MESANVVTQNTIVVADLDAAGIPVAQSFHVSGNSVANDTKNFRYDDHVLYTVFTMNKKLY